MYRKFSKFDKVYLYGHRDAVAYISRIRKSFSFETHEVGVAYTTKGIYITISPDHGEVDIIFDGIPIIMYHTHPDGPCRPSYADIKSTLKHTPSLDIIEGNDGIMVCDCTSDEFRRFKEEYVRLHGWERRRLIENYLRGL